jgi:hypothetical protein
MDHAFLGLIERARAQTPLQDRLIQTVMLVTDDDGTLCAYDFRSNSKVRIDPVPETFISEYSGELPTFRYVTSIRQVAQ